MARNAKYLDDINDVSDPTQAIFRPRARAVGAAGVVPDPSTPAPSQPLQPTTNPASSVWDNVSPGAGTGLSVPTFASVQDAARRADAAGQDKAANAAMYGDPSTFAPGSKPPIDIRRPVAPVFSANGNDATVLNPLGRPTAAAQPPVVRPTPIAAAAPVSATGIPGAAGNMASVIPGVAAAGPIQQPGAQTSFADRATAAGGVKQADGSFAFSNIPGKAGYNANINSLGNNTNIANAANMANPGLGVATSLATGGAITPALSADNVGFGGIQRPVPQNNAEGDRIEAERNMQSDLASIFNEDPRSPLGIAARNMRLNLGGMKQPKNRSGARGVTPYDIGLQNMIEGVRSQAGYADNAANRANALTNTALTQDAAGERARLNAATQIYDAGLRLPQAQQIMNADGTLGLLGADGIVRPALDASGKPVKPVQKKEDADVARGDALRSALAKSANDILMNASPGKAATGDQIQSARLQAAQLHGLQVAKGKRGDYIVNINGEWQPL